MAANVDIFMAAMKTAFLNSYGNFVVPPVLKSILDEVPSSTRTENYGWLAPTPKMTNYAGYRRYFKQGAVTYSITNQPFDSAIAILKDDINDDQVGGYTKKASELAQKAGAFKYERSLQFLTQGASTVCWDGTNFFASSHTIGMGNNTIAFTAAGSSDATTHYVYALVVDNPIKPLIWQNREDVKTYNNAGQFQSDEEREIKFICEMRGAPLYGYWWDAIKVTITNTPNVADMYNLANQLDIRFRTFKAPKVKDEELDSYIHDSKEFTNSNYVWACSPSAGLAARQLSTQSNFVGGATAQGNASTKDNEWKGMFSVISSGLLS